MCVYVTLCYIHLYLSLSLLQIEPSLSLFSELKYSEKRGWKKLCFEFSRAQLSYQKDSRVRVLNL